MLLYILKSLSFFHVNFDSYVVNTPECNYDDGDCLEFNEKYPNCNVTFSWLVGDVSDAEILQALFNCLVLMS